MKSYLLINLPPLLFMKNQQGFVSVAILIAIVLGLIVVGGGAYYVMQKNSPSSTADTFRVISPNGGESYAIGDTVKIKSVGGHMSDMRGPSGGISNGYFLVDAAGNAKELGYAGNTYQWKIVSHRDGTAIVPGTYKIRVKSSRGPCRGQDEACLGTMQDDGDGTFTITQGTAVPVAGILEGSATISAGMSYYQAMLSLKKREEKPDPYKGMPYTLINVAIVSVKNNGTFSVNLHPGTYWVELTQGFHSDGSYIWPEVVGLPTTITIKSGERTTLNYSIDKTL